MSSRRSGGGPSATQQPRMSFNQPGGVTGYYPQQPHQTMIRTQQPRPTAYVNTSTQIRMPTAYMTRGQQPMQFQQPPPPTGQQQVPGQPQQQPPPQASQQPQLGQSPYPQHAHPMMMMAYQQPRVFYPAAQPIYAGPNMATSFSQPQPVQSYSQPPPTMPNQVSQQRPQTPPNHATIGIPGAHAIINAQGGTYSIPAVAANPMAAGHPHMQQQPQAPIATAPPTHTVQPPQGVTGNPSGTIPQQPQATFQQPRTYVKRARTNAISIVNPDTNEVVDVAKTTSTATSEGSPAPSEAASVTEVNEIKDEIVSKDEPATVEISTAAVTLAEDKPAPEVAKDGANPPNAMGNSEVDSTPTPSVAVPPAEVVAPEVVETPTEVALEAEKEASEQTTTVIHPVTSSSDAGKDDSQKADGKSKAKNKKEEATIKASDQEQAPLKVENDINVVEGSEAHKDIKVNDVPAVVETKTAAPAPVIAEPEPSVDVSNKVVDSPEVNATDAPNAANDINSHLEPISDDELNDSVAKEATDADETVAETAMENGTDSACSSNATSKSSSQIKLKYEYPEEQWSPINTEGKKQYGRDFLLKLANDPLSKQKPSNMPPMDIIKDKPNVDKAKFPLPQGPMSRDWTPSFIKSTTSKGGMGGTKGGSRGPKDPNKRPVGPGQPVIQLNLNQNVELNKAENAWKPQNKKGGSVDPDGEEDPCAELERNVRSILNKLTPQKFDKLVKQFNELKIDSEKKLANSIELIFEKAVDEPEFSVAYAKMCDVLREKKVPKGDNSQQPVDFRKLLVTRCQKEFERDYMEGFDKSKYDKEYAACTTEDDRKALKLDFEAKERRARRRSLGNIRFIGELYNLKMLTDRIMHEIINKLIHQIDEESLECLCWLFNTIGKVLEQSTLEKINGPSTPDANKAKAGLKHFDIYFRDMEHITKTKQDHMPSRVRFMIQDVIDLRRNNWKPRREKAGPKTLDQIHQEAEREKMAKKLMESQPLPSVPQGGGGGNRNNRGGDDNRNKRGSSRGGGHNQQGGDDEWSTVNYKGGSRSSNFGQNEKIDTQKLLGLANNPKKDADNISLGPSMGMANRGWGKGSGSAAKSSHGTQQGNRYAAIQNSESSNYGADNRDQGSRQRYQASASMGNFNRHGSNSRGSSVDERQSALSAVKQFSGSSSNGPMPPGGMGGKGMPSSHSSNVISANSAGNNATGGMVSGGPSMSMSSMSHMQAPSSVNEATCMANQTKLLKGPKDMAMDRLKTKSHGIVDEYLQLCDKNSTMEDICLDFHPDHMKDVAEEIVMYVIEKKLKDVKKTGELLDFLVTKHALLPSQLENAFYILLDMSPDLIIDIPTLMQNVAMLLTPVLASEKSLPMKFLLECVKHLESDLVPKFLKEVLIALVEIKGGSEKVADMMTQSGVTIQQLLPADKVADFISRNPGLDFLSPKDHVRSNLSRLLRENPFNKDDVISWIQENIPVQDRENSPNGDPPKEFLRSLARAVAEGSFKYDKDKNEWTLEELKLTDRCALVQKYVDADTKREKQVLCALHHLMEEMEHPNKMLTNIFFCLYNNDVISEQGFEAWLACEEPADQQGKGVAIKSTSQFFLWMREKEEDDEIGEGEE